MGRRFGYHSVDVSWCYNMQPSNYRTIISLTFSTPIKPRRRLAATCTAVELEHLWNTKAASQRLCPSYWIHGHELSHIILSLILTYAILSHTSLYSILDLTRHINKKTSMLADCALFTLYGDIFRHQLSPHQWQLSLVKHTDFQRTQRTQESCAQNREPMQARPFDTPQFGLCFAR